MKAIYKYPLNFDAVQVIKVPYLADVHNGVYPWSINTQIMDVQVQHDQMVAWIMVDNDAPTRDVLFRLVTTGMEFDKLEPYDYVKTIQFDEGHFVLHAFAKGIDKE